MLRTPISPVLQGGPAVVSALDLIPPSDGTQAARSSGDPQPDAPGGEVAFVDAGIDDLAALLAGLKPGVEVALLDSSSSAIGQIATVLDGRESLAAIHIVANGAEEQIAFGAGSFGPGDLASHAGELATIGSALGAGGEILMWNRDTGAGSIGQAFVESLARATGAVVRGGDWALEAQSGGIEARVSSIVFAHDGAAPEGSGISSGHVTVSPFAGNEAPTVALATDYLLPVGGEERVNTTTANSQQNPAIAPLKDGGYVVTWESFSQDGSGEGVYGQRYAADGTAVGGEFRVNTTTNLNQNYSSAAALDDGGFLIVWQSSGGGDGLTVFAQRYDANGDRVGGEFQVNETSPGAQGSPSVAMLSGGGFVVSWQSTGQDGSGEGVYARRYDASGSAIGGEFRVNTTTADNQQLSVVTGLSDGGFVVAWASNAQDGSGQGIFAQRYDSDGVAAGLEFRVNTTTVSHQFTPAIASLPGGGFVVTWESFDTSGELNNIMAQRYDATGAPLGGEFRVNTTTANSQSQSSVTALSDGGFLVSWSSQSQDGNEAGVYAQRYDASGVALGGEFRVNTTTANSEFLPAVAGLEDGGVAIVWNSSQDGSSYGIYSQVYVPALAATEQVPVDLKGQITIGDVDAGSDIITVTLSVTEGVLNVDPGTSGVSVDDSDQQHIILTGTLAQIQALLGSDPTSSVTYTYDDDFLPVGMLQLGVTIDDGFDSGTDTVLIALTPVNDAPYLDLDFTDSTANGQDSAASWAEGDAPVLLAFAVELDDDDADNSYPGAVLTVGFTANGTADDQLSILSVGDGPGELRVTGSNVYYEGTLVGTLTGGTDGTDLVVTFNADACHCAVQLVISSITFANDSDAPDETDRTVTFTLVDGGGTALGGTDTASADITVSVSAVNDAPTVTIDAPTVPYGDEHLVNTTTAGNQQDAQIAALDDGGYVVVWPSTAPGFTSVGIYAQIFDADGVPRGPQFLIDTLSDPDFTHASVSATPGGGFVVTWQDNATGFGRFVAAQRFDSLGDPEAAAVQVTPPGTGGFPAVTGLAGGGYVVTWIQNDAGNLNIHAQIYDANDTPVGTGFTANATTAGTQNGQSVASLADGGFVISWTSINGGATDIFAQRFDASGAPVGGEFLVPTASAGNQEDSVVTGLANGGFVITWAHILSNSDVNVHAQIYDAAGDPVGSELVVSTPSSALQRMPTITALDDGGFLIAWKSGNLTGNGDIYAQRYDASGNEVGSEFRVTGVTNERYEPVVAGLADGGFAIAWHSVGQDGSAGGIYSQVYAPSFAATEQVPVDLKGLITIGDVDAGSDIITVTLSVSEGVLNVDPGTSGVTVDDSDQQNIVLTGTLAEIQALLGSDPTSSVTYTYDDDFLPVGMLQLDVNIDDGFASATDTVLIALTPVNDAAELDLDFSTPGNDAVATYYGGDPATPLAYFATFDDDNSDWDGATLTIAITGATADDQLSVDEMLLTDVTIVGNQVFYQGDPVGTWSGGTNGTPLVFTFNADACACAIEEITYSIAYSSSGTVTGSSTRDVTFTFVDGDGTANGGADTATATVELTVTPAPSPPVIDAGAAASGDEDAVIAMTGITITDDGDPVTGLITVHLGVAHGTLTIRTDVPGGIDSSNIVNSASGHGITIIGTPDQINATLAEADGLTYQGDPEYSGSDALTITANDGPPGAPLLFSSAGAIPFGDFPSAAAFHDLDNDGIDDMVLGIGDGSGPGGVLIFTGGAFGVPLPSGAADAFAFGDFDGDNQIDIGVASYAADGSGYVGYISSDTGDFVTLENIPYALDLASGDFDQNGLMDLAVANSDGGNIAILLQTAPGVFAPAVYSASSGVITASIRTGDFNGDGYIDLLASHYGDVTTYAPPGSVELFLGNGGGSFAPGVTVWSGPSNADGLAVGDFNGEGYDDFAFASSDDTGQPGGVRGVQVVLSNGDGTFGAATSYVTTATGRPSRVVAADLNGDGIDDLVVANMDDPGTISVLLGNGDGSFQAPVQLDTGDTPYVIAAGDPDDDGDLDLIVGNAGDGTYEAFNNDSFHRGDTDVKAITVNNVNDLPTGTSVTINAVEDEFRLLTVADLGFSDVDGSFASVTFNGAAGGNIYFDADGTSGAGVPVLVSLPQTYTVQDLIDGKVSFRATANGNGTAYASIGFTVTDSGGASSASPNTLTVDVAAVPDTPVAQPDSFTITEAGGITGGNLFANNGSGADSSPDSPGVIAEVNGVPASVGTQITLASGALLTVRADGTFDYDPNGKFVTLTGSGSGAVNTSGEDSFTYKLSGGNTVTVTVTMTGITGPGDRLAGDGTNNVITGTGSADFFIDSQGGDDDFSGMGGNDVFLFFGNLTSSDKVDGGAGLDQIAIQGDYGTQLTLGTGLINLESLAILPGFDTRFGDPGTNFYDYNIKTVDANVAAGVSFIVDANRLRLGEDFTFDGSAETDGSFFIYGGGGTDTLTGGSQNDAFYFGESNQFGATDRVFGGAGTDQLGLRGDYTVVFGANQLNSIENIGMVSALDTRFGALGVSYHYDLTMNDANVLAGQQMTVDAAALRATETLTFNGSAETDGSFRVFGGLGNDVIIGSQGDDILVGWAGADSLTGGLGNDVFRYNVASDSTAAARDTIQDFTSGDTIDLDRIDADSTQGGNQAFSFIGGAAFGHHAGELRYENAGGNTWTVQGDIDGDGVADFEVTVVITDSHSITTSDFLL